jgi:hypothetical protein
MACFPHTVAARISAHTVIGVNITRNYDLHFPQLHMFFLEKTKKKHADDGTHMDYNE